ncbi:unnamed protein product [Adineta ricciae]|uniref:Maelstrom domain-containing protein n=1 Tax=Adineta ricciae TaxID=249248 RepID=A0A813TQG4_ADIRI|nr:unnamed protein product [Adineta ricciae]CAF1005891.1 unnamed protein product [Adineta ricciae]
MPSKRKSQVNRTGVYYLADEHRKLHPAYSRMNIQDLILHLLPQWRSMTLVEKKPYEDLAKQYKRSRMLKNEHVVTPVIPSSEEVSFLEQNNNENNFLDSYLSKNLLTVFKRDFLFISFQIFCRTDDEDGGEYYPAEVAIMRYSFAEKIEQEYYTIMKPEKFPVGYTGTAIDLSRETHQIPPFDFIGANGDYAQIWREVRRVIGESIVDTSTIQPIVIFCNAFDRAQTTYLLKWLASKDETQVQKPSFRVCSFEALVAALLRRLGIGDFAHQSVREQLRRPVYTLQIKDRCIYHDSLAIQYCCRAINHGFSLLLDGFVRERFIQKLPEHIQIKLTETKSAQTLKPDNVKHEAHSVSDNTTSSVDDSISSTYLEKHRGGLRRLTQLRKIEEQKSSTDKLQAIGANIFIQSPSSNPPSTTTQRMSVLSIENKLSKIIKPRTLSPMEVDCRWPISSLYNNNTDDEDLYVMTGRGLRKANNCVSTTGGTNSEPLIFTTGIGRGRRLQLIAPVPGFPM